MAKTRAKSLDMANMPVGKTALAPESSKETETFTVQTVKLDSTLNSRLGIFRATHKPKMTNQDTLVAALTEYLDNHGA